MKSTIPRPYVLYKYGFIKSSFKGVHNLTLTVRGGILLTVGLRMRPRNPQKGAAMLGIALTVWTIVSVIFCFALCCSAAGSRTTKAVAA